jgi:hypothetical protein
MIVKSPAYHTQTKNERVNVMVTAECGQKQSRQMYFTYVPDVCSLTTPGEDNKLLATTSWISTANNVVANANPTMSSPLSHNSSEAWAPRSLSTHSDSPTPMAPLQGNPISPTTPNELIFTSPGGSRKRKSTEANERLYQLSLDDLLEVGIPSAHSPNLPSPQKQGNCFATDHYYSWQCSNDSNTYVEDQKACYIQWNSPTPEYVQTPLEWTNQSEGSKKDQIDEIFQFLQN